MTRSVLFLVLSAFAVVSSSHDNFVVQAKKTLPAARTPPPNSLGSNAPSKDCYQPSCAAKPGNGDKQCSHSCNTDAGSICINLSGGVDTDPSCTCNTAADCPPPTDNRTQYTCGKSKKPNAPHTYKGNVCYVKCNRCLTNNVPSLDRPGH